MSRNTTVSPAKPFEMPFGAEQTVESCGPGPRNHVYTVVKNGTLVTFSNIINKY